MLDFLGDWPSERKFRLFGVACWRRLAHLITRGEGLGALAVAEKYADGLATAQELKEGERNLGDAWWGVGGRPYGLELILQYPFTLHAARQLSWKVVSRAAEADRVNE